MCGHNCKHSVKPKKSLTHDLTAEKPLVYVDKDANFFAIVGAASKALQAKGLDFEAMAMVNEALGSESEHEAIQALTKYVEFKK